MVYKCKKIYPQFSRLNFLQEWSCLQLYMQECRFSKLWSEKKTNKGSGYFVLYTCGKYCGISMYKQLTVAERDEIEGTGTGILLNG